MNAFARRLPQVGHFKTSRSAGVCRYVCMSVQALSPLEPKRLFGSGRTNIHSICRNSGMTMATVSDRFVTQGTCHVRSRKPLQKSSSRGCRRNQWTDWAKTLCDDGHLRRTKFVWGYIGAALLARATVTCHRHVPNYFMHSFIAAERLARLRGEGNRSTWTDGGKIALSIVEESCDRIPTKPER